MNENNKNSALLEIYTKILHKGKSLILILIFVTRAMFILLEWFFMK